MNIKFGLSLWQYTSMPTPIDKHEPSIEPMTAFSISHYQKRIGLAEKWDFELAFEKNIVFHLHVQCFCPCFFPEGFSEGFCLPLSLRRYFCLLFYRLPSFFLCLTCFPLFFLLFDAILCPTVSSLDSIKLNLMLVK